MHFACRRHICRLPKALCGFRNAKISPDGSRIAFTYKGDIFTVPTGGGEVLRLTSQPSTETTLIWSPDSRSIAFSSDRFGNADIFVIAADGSSKEMGSASRIIPHRKYPRLSRRQGGASILPQFGGLRLRAPCSPRENDGSIPCLGRRRLTPASGNAARYISWRPTARALCTRT